jgi:zinc/manganese transport system permease protein
VPIRLLSLAFLMLLGLAAASASQITGALLVFALLVIPAATAQTLTSRPGVSLVLTVGLGVTVTWLALLGGFYSQYPIGFYLTTFAFAPYLVATIWRRSQPGSRVAT